MKYQKEIDDLDKKLELKSFDKVKMEEFQKKQAKPDSDPKLTM